ncbi:MAG: DUF2332 domain-containing protein [Actinomycetales bacterium]
MGNATDSGSSPAPPARPNDDEIVPVDVQLAWQEHYCRTAGAPTAALVLQSVREDLAQGGPCAEVLPERTRFGDRIGLRIMAALHLLAIERQAPQIALHVPTLGGIAPDASPDPPRERIRFRSAVIDAISEHADRIRAALDRVPQTNEVGRCIPLRIGLSHVARVSEGLSVRLLEIGSSAGLNLRADHLPGLGQLEVGPLPDIVERLGCDLHPIDPGSTAGRARLTSYIWLDDTDRYERLRQALDVAGRVPARVVQQDAVEFTESISLVPGTATVLWHSAMWIYLSPADRERIEQGIQRLGEQASPEQPFWHLCWEWATDPGITVPQPGSDATFSLIARCWAGHGTQADEDPWTDGEVRILASGTSHGRSVLASSVRGGSVRAQTGLC